MDDGSFDETLKIINGFINEKKILIKYYYQENQGKMTAINNLIQYVSGDYILELDSDDYLAKNAFKDIEKYLQELNNDKKAYALAFLKCNRDGEVSGKLFDDKTKVSTMFDLYFKYDKVGERALLFKSDIRKKYFYPVYSKEKFVTEDSMHYEMDKLYHIIGINKPLIIFEYKNDGYTKNIKKQFMQNPKGYVRFFNSILDKDLKDTIFSKRLYAIKHFILFSYLANIKKPWKRVINRSNRTLVKLLYIPAIIKSKIKFNKKENRIFIAAYTLDVGGIETALVNLVKALSKKYNITLALEKKQGVFLDMLPENVKVIEYTPNDSKNVFYRKISNLLKRLKFCIKYKNKFMLSISFATYSFMAAFTARNASKNSLIWIHNNYRNFFNGDEEKCKNFFETLKIKKFESLVFVSKDSLNVVLDLYPELKNKLHLINNLVDYNFMFEKAKEKIDMEKSIKCTFLNVARHDEHSKRLTRLIEASKLLKEEGESFKVILVGNGPDTAMYKNLVQKYELQNEVIFVGEKKNPYPYFEISDCFVLTSEYEGYPVVFNEARILKLPIITTNVSDSMTDIDKKFGVVVKSDSQSIKNAMKDFIKYGFEIKEDFNCRKYNYDIIKKLEELM